MAACNGNNGIFNWYCDPVGSAWWTVGYYAGAAGWLAEIGVGAANAILGGTFNVTWWAVGTAGAAAGGAVGLAGGAGGIAATLPIRLRPILNIFGMRTEGSGACPDPECGSGTHCPVHLFGTTSGSAYNRDAELIDSVECHNAAGSYTTNIWMYCHSTLMQEPPSRVIAEGDEENNSQHPGYCQSYMESLADGGANAGIQSNDTLLNHFYFELTAPPGEGWDGPQQAGAWCDGQGSSEIRCTYYVRFKANGSEASQTF